MGLIVPLPKGVRDLLPALADGDDLVGCHPGLTLDKYGLTCDERLGKVELQKDVQKPVCEQIVRLSNDERNPPMTKADYAALFARWQATLGNNGFTGTTAGPLTLHLARASALENAGICFHRIYGFVYLPGSGLKGLARAFACEVWLGEQPDKAAAWKSINAVFGTAPSPWLNDLAKRHEQVAPKEAVGGATIFHDAWPLTWPKLVTDILNSHHPKYYQNGDPPGDWEDPVPVYFLSVEPGTKFRFAVAPRRSDTDPELVKLAREWLIGGLTQLGAGAKTASGYGDFTVDEPKVAPVVSAKRPTFTATLELITPAFIGEANKHAVRLRSASVKALLRKWWRAAHPHLTVDQLHVREGELFGDTERGQGALIRTSPSKNLTPWPRGQDMGGGGSPLCYLGYGPIQYDKPSKCNLTQFDALSADQKVTLTVCGRSDHDRRELARAVWLFTALGGIGSRNRRGWGSLGLVGINWVDHGLPDLSSAGHIAEYQRRLTDGLEMICPTANRPTATTTQWTALTTDTRLILSGQSFSDWRQALEDLGRKFMRFRSYDRRGNATTNPPGPDYTGTKNLLTDPKRLPKGTQPPPVPVLLPERAGFGLPYIQQYRSMNGDTANFTPVWGPNNQRVSGRRASPLLFKVVKLGRQIYHWQVVYLPSQFLPSGATVRAERTKPRPPEQLPFGNPRLFPPPGVFGIPRPGRSPEETLVKDFLNWLQEGEPALSDNDLDRRVLASPPPSTGPALAAGERIRVQVIRRKGTGAPVVKHSGQDVIVTGAPPVVKQGDTIDVLVEQLNPTTKTFKYIPPGG